MSHTRRRYKGPTRPRACIVPVILPGHVLPVPCGDRTFKAGRCRDHWLDKRHGQESRRGTEAVNIQRRERNGTPLPKDLSRASVPVRTKWVEKKEPPTIDDRRKKQGVSQATQDFLIDRAARARARKAGVYSPTPKRLAHFRSVRT